MPDETSPLPNPVLPGPVPFAISPLERAVQQAPAVPAGPQPSSGFDHDAARRLAEARKADLGQPPAPREDPTPADPAVIAAEPLLKPRRPSGNDIRHEKDFRTLKGKLEAAELELSKYRNANGNQPPSAELDITKLPFEKLAAHPELARLKQERDTFYEEIKHVRVESDPEFRAKFDTKRDAALRVARSVAGAAGDDIARILSINDADVRAAQLADRIKDFGEGAKAKIIAANANLTALEVEREVEIAARKATWEATQSQRQAAQASAFETKLAKMDAEFQRVWEAACHPESGIPFLLDDKVKAAVLPDARRVFSGESDAHSLAQAALQAALLPHVIQSAQAAWQEVERLRAANGTYAQTWPTDQGGGYEQQPTSPPPPINYTGYDRHFGGGLAAARARDLGQFQSF